MKSIWIKKHLILLSTAICVFFLVAFFSIYRFNRNSEDAYMRLILNEVESAYDAHSSFTELLIFYQTNENRRVTILDDQKKVVIDSFNQYTLGEDKSNRPEINDLGTVYKRYSNTTKEDMLYIAMQKEEGYYIRVSLPSTAGIPVYQNMLVLMAISGVLIISLSYTSLYYINKNMLKPWASVKDHLNELVTGTYQTIHLDSPYPEINETLKHTNDISLLISRQMHHLRTYKNQLSHILDEINIAIMLFNDKREMTYFNQDAKILFNLEDSFINLKSHLFLREIQLQKAIDKVVEEKSELSFDLLRYPITIEINIFLVDKSLQPDALAHVIVMAKDVTELRVLEQSKKDFFSHASHELKSPITAIKGYAELIEHNMVTKDEMKEIAIQINHQATHMNALVEDMLILSRLETLKEIPKRLIRLDDKLNEVTHLLSPIALEKQIDLSIVTQEISMKADELDMIKLFKNIIENAIKYSHPNQSVEIQLVQDDTLIKFIVKDQGIGIDTINQKRVFERFFRVDKGRLDTGTGLGLAIVKHTVIKYQGSIELKSRLGKGTEIIISFKKQSN